jgi:hypothetical protein
MEQEREVLAAKLGTRSDLYRFRHDWVTGKGASRPSFRRAVRASSSKAATVSEPPDEHAPGASRRSTAPLGNITGTRKEVYRQSSILRHRLNHQVRKEPRNLAEVFGS